MNIAATPKSILKEVFGYDSFRDGQEKIIHSILQGNDSLAIMPTGAGKSICYQVPALMLPGITLVISPLISLMQDQVKALNEAGILDRKTILAHCTFLSDKDLEFLKGKDVSICTNPVSNLNLGCGIADIRKYINTISSSIKRVENTNKNKHSKISCH